MMLPRTAYDYRANLRRLQQALMTLDIKQITFDIYRAAELSYQDNWLIISKLHKVLAFKDNNVKELAESRQVKQSCSKDSLQKQNICDRKDKQENVQKQEKEEKTDWCNITRESDLLKPKGLITQNNPFNLGMNVLNTPLKNIRSYDQNGKFRPQLRSTIDDIRSIVTKDNEKDRVKVSQLKKMLGLHDEDSSRQEQELNNILSGCKKPQEVVEID